MIALSTEVRSLAWHVMLLIVSLLVQCPSGVHGTHARSQSGRLASYYFYEFRSLNQCYTSILLVMGKETIQYNCSISITNDVIVIKFRDTKVNEKYS